MTDVLVHGFLISLGASILALLIAMALESCRRPKLLIGKTHCIKRRHPFGHKNPLIKSLLVDVENKQMPCLLKWAWDRNPAQDCRAKIEFLYKNGERALEKEMTGRWASTPEPIAPVLYPSSINEDIPKVVTILDPNREQPSVIIGPGRTERLDVVFRINDEEFPEQKETYQYCWGWNNEGYMFDHRPEKWKLPARQFIARITVTSGGQSTTADFKIINDLGFGQFRLERVPTR